MNTLKQYSKAMTISHTCLMQPSKNETHARPQSRSTLIVSFCSISGIFDFYWMFPVGQRVKTACPLFHPQLRSTERKRALQAAALTSRAENNRTETQTQWFVFGVVACCCGEAEQQPETTSVKATSHWARLLKCFDRAPHCLTR